MTSKTRISVIGLGKLGLPLALCISSKGYDVVGMDRNGLLIERLIKGEVPIKENDLKGLLNRNIIYTENLKKAISETDITFLILPTPSDKNGIFISKYLEEALTESANILKDKTKYHLFVIVSTVMPTTTSNLVKMLEERSRKKIGRDFGICYNPEFVAIGSVVRDILNPELILIGESDKKAGKLLEDFYRNFLNKRIPIIRTNFVNAEISKLSINTYVTTKISYANMLSEMCENIPGGDVDVVTGVLGHDSRIGSKYLKAGAAFGGTCFPRDNRAFVALAKKIKVSFDISDATQKINLRQVDRLSQVLQKIARKKDRIAILGLSYKPFTDVVEESPGMILAQNLLNKGYRLNLHDPWAMESAKKTISSKVIYFDSLKECIANSDTIIIMTLWPEYKEIRNSWYKTSRVYLIDPWRLYKDVHFSNNITYIGLGLAKTY